MFGQRGTFLCITLEEFGREETSLGKNCIQGCYTMALAQNKAVPVGTVDLARADFEKVPVQVDEKLDKGKGTSQMRSSGLMGKLYDPSTYSSCNGKQRLEFPFGLFGMVSGSDQISEKV